MDKLNMVKNWYMELKKKSKIIIAVGIVVIVVFIIT